MKLEITGWMWRKQYLLVEMNLQYILFVDTEPYSGCVYSFDTVLLGNYQIDIPTRKAMVDLFRKEKEGLFDNYPKKKIENLYRNRFVEKYGEIV